VYGVLQRIAICYVISAMVALWSSRRGQVLAIVGCLVSYWVLMRFVPVPGFGVPTHDMPFLDPNRNLAAWLDRKLLMGHLYDVTRDPEGVISTIPAIATSLLGVLTGGWVRSERSPQSKALGLVAVGVVGLIAGKVLDLWFPINKNLWTPSFVIFTAGFAMVALGICYWILDIQQWRGWAKPFLVFGVNPIAAYVFAEMIAHWIDRMGIQLADGSTMTWQEKIYQRLFAPLASPPNASLLYALTYVLMCWAAMWALERKGIYLKI
jgi:predicted acyltransferase